ncbi:MAG: hypothetical protein CL769_02900 [Chloroflexi bacterium]|nr:hypothetical protein [Chloroflexota bacterium]|tara:strand:+ start:350 stop:637 length:288 start_codon:yes stop_codon:yes gene_type:complete
MYGSIFNLKPKKGKKEALIDHLKNDQDRPEGGVAWYVLNPDNDGDLVGIAIFKDKESYKANAERPEQHDNFMKMMDFLVEQPKWNDGNFVIGENL